MKKLTFLLLIISANTLQGQTFSRPYLLRDDCEATNKPVFQGGYPPASWGSKQGDASNPFVRSTEAAATGVASYKATVNNNATVGYFYCKSELVWNFLPAGSPLGTVGDYTAYYRENLGLRWVEAKIMIPTYNNDYNTPTGIGFNTKSVEDDWGSGTAFGLQMYQGRYRILMAAVTKTGTTYSWAWAQGGAIDMGPVVKGQWERWTLNRNFTSDPATGFVRFYKNGVLMFEHIGGNWYDDGRHSREPYLQMGLYKWAFDGYTPAPDVSSVTAFYDDFAFADSTATEQTFQVGAYVGGGGGGNVPPVANAGVYQLRPSGSTTATLNGSGSTDIDGTISTYAWSQVSGPNTATFSSTSVASPSLSGMTNGTYNLQLIVTDNGGAKDTAFVNVKVNQLPVISETNQLKYTNATSINLTSTITDADGSIASILVEQAAGDPVTLSSTTSAKFTVSGMTAPNNYVIRITATDNDGESSILELFIENAAAFSNRVRKKGRAKQITN